MRQLFLNTEIVFASGIFILRCARGKELLLMFATTDPNKEVPLCVDLDDTHVRTDLLFETVVLLGRRNPFALLALPLWLVKGRAYLKRQIALRVQPDVSGLPFRSDLVAFLNAEKKRGRTLALVSAADK